MIGTWVRKTGFWSLDRLKGSPVKKRYEILKSIREGKTKSDALEGLLRHAIDTVPAYRHVVEPKLSVFPVVSKNDYRHQYEQYRSSSFDDENKLHAAYTSGSTGTPFKALQNGEKLLWHRAGLIGLNESIGWGLGECFMFMRLWGVAHASSKLSQIISNTIPVEVLGLDSERCETIRQRILRDKTLCMIIGYASAMEKLADVVLKADEKPADYGLKLVMADSESLSPEVRAKLEKAFGCPVYNRYGNNENGILALAGPDNDVFKVNFPEYYVEVLKLNTDEPVSEGKAGRIVITDLFNYAFPFIRYDTGDLGIAGKYNEDGCCVEIRELLGRVSAALANTNGDVVAETEITAHFENMVDIGRYQVVQEGMTEYEVLLEATSEQLDGEIVNRLRKCMGEDAVVRVTHVDEIKQGKNGKYPITINKVK